MDFSNETLLHPLTFPDNGQVNHEAWKVQEMWEMLQHMMEMRDHRIEEVETSLAMAKEAIDEAKAEQARSEKSLQDAMDKQAELVSTVSSHLSNAMKDPENHQANEQLKQEQEKQANEQLEQEQKKARALNQSQGRMALWKEARWSVGRQPPFWWQAHEQRELEERLERYRKRLWEPKATLGEQERVITRELERQSSERQQRERPSKWEGGQWTGQGRWPQLELELDLVRELVWMSQEREQKRREVRHTPMLAGIWEPTWEGDRGVEKVLKQAVEQGLLPQKEPEMQPGWWIQPAQQKAMELKQERRRLKQELEWVQEGDLQRERSWVQSQQRKRKKELKREALKWETLWAWNQELERGWGLGWERGWEPEWERGWEPGWMSAVLPLEGEQGPGTWSEFRERMVSKERRRVKAELPQLEQQWLTDKARQLLQHPPEPLVRPMAQDDSDKLADTEGFIKLVWQVIPARQADVDMYIQQVRQLEANLQTLSQQRDELKSSRAVERNKRRDIYQSTSHLQGILPLLDQTARTQVLDYSGRHWRALQQQRVEERAYLLRRNLHGRPTLRDVILRNHDNYTRQSPYLDALLVFAGLFSAILAAFLIDIRKGLQEDLLQAILQQLQNVPQTFQPTPVSIWVNGLWFTSLAASLIGALVVMLAKFLGRWTINKEDVRAIFSLPERLEQRLREITRIQMHAAFDRVFTGLIATASVLIYISLILFFAGLGVLLITTQKAIGISFVAITSLLGIATLAAAFFIFRKSYGQ